MTPNLPQLGTKRSNIWTYWSHSFYSLTFYWFFVSSHHASQSHFTPFPFLATLPTLPPPKGNKIMTKTKIKTKTSHLTNSKHHSCRGKIPWKFLKEKGVSFGSQLEGVVITWPWGSRSAGKAARRKTSGEAQSPLLSTSESPSRASCDQWVGFHLSSLKMIPHEAGQCPVILRLARLTVVTDHQRPFPFSPVHICPYWFLSSLLLLYRLEEGVGGWASPTGASRQAGLYNLSSLFIIQLSRVGIVVCVCIWVIRVHKQQIHPILAIDHIDSFLLLVQMILLVQTYGLFFIINFGPFQLPVAVTSELSWKVSQDALKWAWHSFL